VCSSDLYPAYGTPPWPTRATPPSQGQLERWSLFEPPLPDAVAKGHRVAPKGMGTEERRVGKEWWTRVSAGYIKRKR